MELNHLGQKLGRLQRLIVFWITLRVSRSCPGKRQNAGWVLDHVWLCRKLSTRAGISRFRHEVALTHPWWNLTVDFRLRHSTRSQTAAVDLVA
jgi:hypothetical protein